MRLFLPLICFLFTISGFAQDTLLKHRTRKLVSINYFRINKNPLTKQDSLNWVFYNNDTLIPVEKLASEDPNQVRFPYEPREEDFLKIYKQAVFGTSEEQQEKATIKIWKEPIKLFFDPSVPDAHREELLEFAKKASSGIDSLQITEVQKRANSNFLIFYRHSKDDFDQEERISNERNSGYYLSWNGKQQLQRGVVKINAFQISHGKDQLDLLKYHFFKALGYFHFSTEIPCKSYLSGCPVKRTLTFQDLEILKYHYSYGMCKGINLENFEKIHRDYKKTIEEHPNSEFYLVHTN